MRRLSCRWMLVAALAPKFLAGEPPDCAAMQARIVQEFKGAVELHVAQRPCAFSADFDGDGAVDVASLVRVKSPLSTTPLGASRVSQRYRYHGQGAYVYSLWHDIES